MPSKYVDYARKHFLFSESSKTSTGNMSEQFVELPHLLQLLHPLRYCLGQEAGKLDPDHEKGKVEEESEEGKVGNNTGRRLL